MEVVAVRQELVSFRGIKEGIYIYKERKISRD